MEVEVGDFCMTLAMRGCVTGMSRWYLATCRHHRDSIGQGVFPARWAAASGVETQEPACEPFTA
jgi:hypothetical protein